MEKDYFFFDDEVIDVDNEDEVEFCDNEDVVEVSVGINVGWVDVMVKIFNKKIFKSKFIILVKNKELEKEKEKLK